MNQSLRVLGLLAVLPLAACGADDATGPTASDPQLAASGSSGATENGQSIMVTPTFDAYYILEESQTWHLNLDNARALYTTSVSGPIVTCTGGGSGGVNCLPANQPATPSTPANDPNQPSNSYFAAFGDKNRCTFWLGGDPETPTSYTQGVTINGLNGRGNWTFTWTYGLTAPVGVAPKTAWDLIDSTGGEGANVEISGFVAGQSAVRKTKAVKNDWNYKVSHTISDALGHRVVNLAYSVDGGTPVLFDPLTQLAFESGVDYFYAQNSGNNGFLTLLVDNAFVNVIQNGGKASAGGYLDDFTGNNATLGERVNFFGPTVGLEDGDHTIQLTGTVKGNSGAGNLGINVTKTVTIDAQGCQVPT